MILLLLALGTGWSQNNDTPSPADADVRDSANQTEAGLDSEPSSNGVDLLSDRTSALPLSYMQSDLQASIGAENNPALVSGNASQISAVTEVTGRFTLLKSRRRSQTSITYRGGDTLYSSYGGSGLYSLQSQRPTAAESIRWRRGQISFEDSFSYTSNRGFGSPGGLSVPKVLAGFDSSGAIEYGPAFINNVSGATVTEELTRRSSAQFSGAYSITDYVNNNENLFNSRQVSTQAQYGYQISRSNNIGLSYGYQDIQFVPAIETLVANSAQFIFQHTVSARMELVLGAGPEKIVNSGISLKTQLTPTVQASFNYRGKRSDLSLSYNRVVTSGSGYYAGGIQDGAGASANWKLSRLWEVTTHGGYFRVNVVGLSATGTEIPRFEYWSADAQVRRHLGRSLSAIASYRFNSYSSGACGLAQSCGPAAHLNTVLLGLDWSVRPVRLE